MSLRSLVSPSKAVDPTEAIGRAVVLDLETRSDPLLFSLTTGAKSSDALIQEIGSCSLLFVDEPVVGEWNVERLITVHGEENAILEGIDDALSCSPTLITYNGRRHDIPVIRRRVMRFKRFDLQFASQASLIPHIDLYDFPRVAVGGSHGSLQDRCAALGIDSKTYDEDDDDMRSRMVLKGETDVVATFVLLIHELAAFRADSRVWGAGVRALEQAQGGALARMGHLKQLIPGRRRR